MNVDGVPAPGIMVRFERDGFRAAQGVTNESGRYQLRYIRDIMGGAIGDNLVTFMDTTRERRVPRRYRSEPETATVEPGSNVINFDLTSPDG